MIVLVKRKSIDNDISVMFIYPVVCVYSNNHNYMDFSCVLCRKYSIMIRTRCK